MVVCRKKQKHCLPEELEPGDCWIALSLVQLSGLNLCGRVGKHTDDLAEELVSSTESKTDCTEWNTDGWEGYERTLGVIVDHYVSKALTQRLERTNGILRDSNWALASATKQVWQGMEQTKVTLRLVISYFNWIWQHSGLGTTAAQRAELAERPWTWN